jgi:hypothetical protein
MLTTTRDRLEQFRKEQGIEVTAQDLVTYWVITVQFPDRYDSLHHVHRPKKYIMSRYDGGNVLVLPYPQRSDNYLIEHWGVMRTFDDFVETALARILEDMEESDRGIEEGCGAFG